MKQNIVLSATIISLLFFSCGKEGPQGIPGPQGNAGAVGPAGQDGSIIYSGKGAPATSVGKNGDYYLDDNTGDLYGPKTASGWGTPLSLKGSGSTQGPAGPQGPPGAAGTPGSQIYSGTGAPATSLGNNGDFYLDKQGYLLYGPKTNSAWGTPILLQGAQGIQGPQGPAGVPGSQIFSGNGAPSASIGNTGDYYLDKSTGNFYGPKTTSGWGSPFSLKGANGAQGPAGPQGPQGSQGAAGTPGSQIYSGAGAPPSSTGITGDYYIDINHAIIYGPKTAAGWPSTGLSLQVKNVITYEFDNHLRNNLPYSWQAYLSQLQASIWLPYNNASAQTTGFTIPQAIVDQGLVLCYIRYFKSIASDTATSAGMTPWMELPYSISNNVGNGVSSVYTLSTFVDANGFRIIVNSIQNSFSNFTGAFIPSQIRIVLIPSGQSTVITRVNPSLKATPDEYPLNFIGGN
ncbi:MAG TPA: hypothetical protein VHE34_06255 [Puia sp.]|uniref:hypothetical protein n=1 Tax=Puia sp. TaxID=2045100 RepID=UPI002CCE10E1|nr:hypothetical protein [Puia sp.]HVU94806.1 hypothetical protein [Puia sp.]